MQLILGKLNGIKIGANINKAAQKVGDWPRAYEATFLLNTMPATEAPRRQTQFSTAVIVETHFPHSL